ncbi:protein neprosin [Ziziphus jujuba]|uniref:Protein neprosin n=1 Tax=Ziziphus jujuba TaxID=326968 RepID=A0ABM4AAY9_ZIZJJ|nr:protein neprosin [Ziziphus jujuba]
MRQLSYPRIQGTSKVNKSHRTINLDDDPHFISILPTEADEFDCVDIYKQPAFDHPLLRNHKIQLNPNFSHELTKSRVSSRSRSPNEVDLRGKGCPSGMVPIPKSKPFYRPFTQDFPGEHFATLDTNNNATYHGAQATINIYKPPVTGKQYSMAQIWLQSGPPNELNSIQAGWAVNPTIYGDNLTYMTIRWTTDGFKNTGCYNLLCPGFVQVHPTVRPGQVFVNSSIIGGSQYGFDLSIIQEQSSGNWWLTSEGFRVGYWPKELFNHLNNGADKVRYGGTTKASADGLSPPMGSGEFPTNDYHSVCFLAFVKIVDSNFKLIDIVDSTMSGTTDVTTCYDLHYFGYQGRKLGQTFSFGGPGGECGT